jgi:hypothetical protein
MFDTLRFAVSKNRQKKKITAVLPLHDNASHIRCKQRFHLHQHQLQKHTIDKQLRLTIVSNAITQSIINTCKQS